MTISLKEQFDRSNIETIIRGFNEDLDCEIGVYSRNLFIDQFEVCRNDQGLVHSDDGPAIIGRSSIDPHHTLEAYYQNGLLHHNNRPAITASSVHNQIGTHIESWYQNGVLHRERGPAVQELCCKKSGPVVQKEEWFLNGLRHRIEGPAVKRVDPWSGELEYAAHYRAGMKVSEQVPPTP